MEERPPRGIDAFNRSKALGWRNQAKVSLGNATPVRPSASPSQTLIRLREFIGLIGLVTPPPVPVSAEDFFSIFSELMYSSPWCQAIG